jgi:hypothetical protein
MEQMRHRPERTEGVDVLYGIHRMRFDVAGQTLAQARGSFEAALDIQPGARILADGKAVDEDHIISADETIEFMAEAGKKG